MRAAPFDHGRKKALLAAEDFIELTLRDLGSLGYLAQARARITTLYEDLVCPLEEAR
jgi:hypothetical protein